MSACFSALLGLVTLLLATPSATAQVQCAPSIACGVSMNPASGSSVVLGQTLTINFVSAGILQTSCFVTNGDTWLAYPDGTTISQIMNGFILAVSGTEVDCAGSAGAGGPGNVLGASCLSYTKPYVVNAADIGKTLQLGSPTVIPRKYAQNGNNPSTYPGLPNQIHFFAAAEGDGFNDSGFTSPSGLAYGEGQVFFIVKYPGLTVTKLCDTNCFAYGAPISFHGSICNTGNVTLANITVTDTPGSPVLSQSAITFAATTSSGRAFNPVTGLTNGECVTYFGSYQPDTNFSLCGPFNDTIVASGTATTVFQTPTYYATNHASCSVCTTPGISVTKNCPPTNGVPGGVLGISGQVCNTGNVPLKNVTVVNSLTLLGGGTTLISIPLLPPGACSNWSGVESIPYDVCTLNDTVTARGTNVCDNSGVVATASTNCPILPSPNIKVYKQVVCYAPGGCEAFSSDLTSQKTATGVKAGANCPSFCYRYTVTNAGNVDLTSVTINDSVIAGLTTVFAQNGCSFPTTLTRGGQAGSSFSCVVSNQNYCANTTNIVTVTGKSCSNVNGTVIPEGTTVTAKDTNAVVVLPISVSCALEAPTTCVTVGNNYTVKIKVTNTGSYALDNVIVTSVAGFGNCFGSPLNIGALAIGQTKTNSCTFSCTAVSSNYYAVSVSAVASQATGHICDNNAQGQEITATSSCYTSVLCCGTPRICVTKEVACFLGTNNSDCVVSRPFDPLAPTENCGPFGKLATGVKGDVQNPAFCYRIGVSNCGDITLTNVSVVDDQYGDLTTNFTCLAPIPTLAPGQACEFTFKAEVGQNLTNNVLATGYSIADGTPTNATDYAVVRVLPAAISCVKEFSVDGGPWVSDYTFPDQNSHTVVWRVTVNNLGAVDLVNVSVVDNSSNLVCNYSATIPLIPAGGSDVVMLCTNDSFTCTNGGKLALDNQVLVQADHYSSTNCICAYDIEGIRIVVRSTCDATITCTVPNACRVTGGGRQDSPDVCPLNVRYVTHGGQVGAPVGTETCTIDTSLPNYWLGNPCIHGRWTHVRHMQGGLQGNFHARFYDTLKCVCLGTNAASGTGLYPTNAVTDGVCNRDDHKVAGPQPAPAPANKIVFTGVGDYALTKGNRTSRAVLFRVDIEDRSEPGGSHPKGGVPPADRNRTRIWILTTAELNQLQGKSGPDLYLINFRNQISACNGLAYRDGVSSAIQPPPNSCGSGTITFPGGLPVRAPDIDDGGELDRGNYQLHPSILQCDPANPVGPGLANP